MKYPIGIQSFEQIITEGFVYVDKTALIHHLVTNGQINSPRKAAIHSILLCFKPIFIQNYYPLFMCLKDFPIEIKAS